MSENVSQSKGWKKMNFVLILCSQLLTNDITDRRRYKQATMKQSGRAVAQTTQAHDQIHRRSQSVVADQKENFAPLPKSIHKSCSVHKEDARTAQYSDQEQITELNQTVFDRWVKVQKKNAFFTISEHTSGGAAVSTRVRGTGQPQPKRPGSSSLGI